MTALEIIDLKQKRAKVNEDIRNHLNKFVGDKVEGAEDITSREKMETEFSNLSKTIDREEAQLTRDRMIGEVADPARKPVTDEKYTAFANHLREGNSETFRAYNALSQDNPTQAGYLVAPEKFVSDLIKDIADATFMRQKAKVLDPLKAAQSLGYPTRTSAMSSFAWGTEVQAPTADTSLAYGKREFKPNPATSEILVSNTLIRNVSYADALIRTEIAEEYAKNLETAYMTGSGAGQPLGLFIASSDGIPTSRDVSTHNTASEIKFDNLMDVVGSVKQQYRIGAEWIFHREAITQIRKLKDSAGQYVWQPSVQMGAPDILLAHPVNESEYAPHAFTTGLYVGIFGNLKNYWIVDSLAMEIRVLMELYARTNQADYISRVETDGAPIVSSAFARVKLG